VSDRPQGRAIEGVGRDQVRKRKTSNPQLLGVFVVNYAGIGVDEGDQGLGTLWQEKSGMKHGSLLREGIC